MNSPEQPGLAVLGDVPGEAPLPGPNAPVYSFTLDQGESATVVVESLNNKNVGFTLLDENGDVLASSVPGATNYTAGLNNFVAPNDGTYYVAISGDPGVQFNLVVTRGADFITKPNSTPGTAQDITATELSGDNKLGGVLGYLSNPTGPQIGTSFEGASGTDANNNCGCLPPDTNAAVGGNWVVEAVNTELVIYDKTTGAELFSETLDSLYSPLGQQSEGDVYVVYDQLANRWYVDSIDANNGADLLFAISNDANPLDGFSTQYVVPMSSPGDLSDFPKFGYNADFITFSANDFGNGDAKVTVLNKADALAGTLSFVQLQPSPQFRALVPAQQTTALPGDPIWLVGVPDLGQGQTDNVIRVTELQDPFGSATLTDFFLTVDTYGGYSGAVDQPGEPGSVAANDNTTTQVFDYNGTLVTAFPAGTAADGFFYPKVHYYEVDVSSGTPVLSLQGVIDPGPGVATFFPTVAINPNTGDLGLTWMQSSLTEFVSMYVGTVSAATGDVGVTDAAPGVTTEVNSERNGDYSSVVYDPGTDAFWAANEYAGPNNGSEIWNTWISEFTPPVGVGTDYYAVDANAGDNLHFATTTPAGGPNEFVNNFFPELLLYDPNGNLVAVAAGNASDGRNSVIDFTVPAGDAGKWTIEVTPSPNTPLPSSGEYGLLVTGATGALSPFVVTATTPASGALVQPPTDIIVSFNDPVYAPSLTPGELEVNGVAATAVVLVNGNTVDWTIPASAFATGIDLPNVVTIGADAMGNQVMDVSGQTLTPYSYTFFTTNVAPVIISSSIDGQVFSPAPADVTEVVTFSQPMDTAFTTQASFSLEGNFLNVSYAAASFSWDPTGTILTINYDNLPNDTYTLTLFASGFENLVGIPLASNYVANFAVAVGTAPFTTPFKPVKPLGDLIYTSTDDPVLVTPTDVDFLTLSLNAGETLTLVASPTTSALQLAMEVLDPSNNTIATSLASAPGTDAVIETVAITTTGTYTIEISDQNGNIGQYSVQATLNAFVKTVATANDTIGTAQSLTGTTFGLGTAGADRLAALGTLVGGATFGDALVVETSDVLLINQSSGHIVDKFTSPAFSDLILFDVALAPDNTFYVLGDVNEFTGVIVHMDLQGNTLGSFTLPVSDPGTFLSPEGFGLDPRDGSFWVPLPNSASLLHVDAGGNFISLSPIGANPNDAAVGPDGKIYITQVESGQVSVFDPTTGTDSFFASSPFPLNLTWSVAGDLWVGDVDAGAEEFDSAGNLIFWRSRRRRVRYRRAAEPALSGNIWDTNVSTVTVNQYTASATLLTQTSYSPFQPGLAVLGDVPNEAPLPTPDNQDFYSFDLTQGQTATAVVESLNGKAAQISIVDANGNVLASGVSGATNVSQSIENFVAPATGTYYVKITGDQGVQYSVAVTRGADFTLQPHNSISTAQNITGTGGVLGYLAPPTVALYLLDDNLYTPPFPIWPVDPATGAFTGPSIPAPSTEPNNPFGLNMAYDGQFIYYNDGAEFGTGDIFKLNATTGAVVAQTTTAEGFDYSGLAYLNGNLYATNIRSTSARYRDRYLPERLPDARLRVLDQLGRRPVGAGRRPRS